MKFARQNITYANVVATLALFIALGGVSWAAVKLPRNSVGSAQIKKNAVTSAKIKKNAITGAKIKNNSLTGGDINAASLGKVPNAGRADSAAAVDQVIGISKRVGPSVTSAGSQDEARQNSAEIPVASHGQVSVYAKCYVYSGSLYMETFSKTSADGALVNGGSYTYYGGSGYLNTSTPESQRYLNYAITSNNSGSYSSSSYPSYSLFGADGNGLNVNVSMWVKRGTIATYGNGAFGAGDVCVINGSAVKLNAG